jgi:NTE family protein
METKKKPYKIGLALSGGGSRGFAHIGVFRLLEEYGIRPDIIVGTSAGALTGSLFADGYTADEIEHLFNGREFTDFAKIQIPKSGLFDSNRFSDFMKEHLHEKNIEDLKIPLVVVATDLDNGKGHAFTTGSVAETVRASCSVPIMFSPVLIDGTHYVDGGLFHNFPVSIIRESCEVVIGVNVGPYIPREYSQNLYSIAERSYHYIFQANIHEDRKRCDILVEPENLYNRMFDLKSVETIAYMGYKAAASAFSKFLNENKIEANSQVGSALCRIIWEENKNNKKKIEAYENQICDLSGISTIIREPQ